MQKMLEHEGKERLNNNEFRELIPHLPFGDLLRIEYRKDKWYKLITVVDPVKKLYGCTLCSISNSNAKNLNSHMEGKKHKMNIQDVKQLFHPEYTYVKQDWKLAAGPIKAQPIAKTQATNKSKANEVSAASVSSSKLVNKSQPDEQTKINDSSPPTSSKSKQPLKTPIIDAKSVKAVTLISSPTSTNLKGPNDSKAINSSKAQNLQKTTTPSKLGAEPPTSESLETEITKPNTTKKVSIDKNKSTSKTVEATSTIKSAVTQSKQNINEQETPGDSGKKIPMTATKSVNSTNNKTLNIADPSKQKSPISSSSNNIKKESDTVYSNNDPFKNDPSWNPKVSVKNLNVTKIIKTSAIQSKINFNSNNVAEPKVASKTVGLKPVTLIEKKTVLPQLSEKDQTNKSKHVASKYLDVSVNATKASSLSEKNVLSEEVLLNENTNENLSNDKPIEKDTTTIYTTTIEKTKCNVGKSKINEASSPGQSMKTKQKDPNDFSDDVQFDEIPVTFEEKKKGNQDKMVKNPFALKQDGSKPYRIPKISCVSVDLLKKPVDVLPTPVQIPEVIVIDDDVNSEEKSTETVSYKQIPIIERHAPKPQRQKIAKKIIQSEMVIPSSNPDHTNKRTLETEKTNSDEAKKPKMIMNPAAAFLVDAAAGNKNEEQDKNIETPKYQTDRIIIPTKHKNKEKQGTQSIGESQFDFSTKTFSSKPRDDDVHGLVGVEYVVKIMKGKDDATPRYECSLCELILNGPSMQNHLVGYNHRLKFCEKHFPTAMRQYRQYIDKVPSHEKYKVLTPILAKLAVAIEQHHGRDLPYEVLEYQYNTNRHEILSKVFSCRHASEQHGPAFAHILDVKEIDVIIAQKDNFKPQAGPLNEIFNVRSGGFGTSSKRREPKRQRLDIVHERSSQVSRTQHSHPYYAPSQYEQPLISSDLNSVYVPQVDDETHKQMVADFLRGTHKSVSPIYNQRDQRDKRDKRDQRDQRDRQRHSRKSRSRSRERIRKRSRSRSNQRSSTNYCRKSISPLRDGDIWQAYRHLVDQKLHDLNEVFKVYRNDPETHPMYNEEWQKFWKRRKDELISAGLDHRSYNYQPEWVRFFNVRIEELFSQAFENLKLKCRERLCLSLENKYLSDSKYHVQEHNSGVETPQIQASSRKLLNLEVQGRQNESNIELIPVLRLLTALEEYLGSLGPKIIDLMSKALLEEKTNPNEINDTILTIDNCTLLETAMEKLKGVLLAGLLEGSKERAFRKVIADTESLLAWREKNRKYSTYKTMPQNVHNAHKSNSASILPAPVPAPIAVLPTSHSQVQSTLGSVVPTHAANTKGSSASISTLLAQMDKKELASKLAATLTAQGKTDFNPDQLEQLIAVYTLIEKKKREAAVSAASIDSIAASSNSMLFQPQTSSITSRKTLSDTLVDFMNPSNPNFSTSASNRNVPEDSTAKQSYTAATISRYLDVMRRTGGVFPNTGAGGSHANEIWHNLQNIQRSMGDNTNINQNTGSQLSNIRNNVSFSSVSSFNKPSQFGLSSIAPNGSLNMSSDIQSSFNNSSSGVQLNAFGGSLGSNRNNSIQQYQQQNPYTSNSSPSYQAGGSLFTNTNNNNRVSNNKINTNTQQSLQPRKNIPSLQSLQMQSYQSKTSNQNWTSNSSESFSGTQRWRNQKGGEGMGLSRNPNERSSGKNQNWRNN